MRSLCCVFLGVILLCAFALQTGAAEKSWPQFRGPHGDGHAWASKVPVEFGEQKSVVWRTEIPGKAWSSPVVEDDVIWMTTAIEQKPTAAERKAILESQIENPGNRNSRNVAKSVALKLIAVDFRSGSVLKTIELTTIDQPEAIHTLNSYASPTPMVDQESIYCHFGTYGTFCVDRESGQVIWQRQFPLVHSVGPGSSPLIHGDVLVLIQDGVERQYVTALAKNTGDTVWEVDRPELDISDGESKKSFCTPISVMDKRGREQVICVGAHWVIAYEPKTGEEIWKCNHGTGFSIVPRPVCDGDVVYFSTGYGKPIMLAVHIDGDGDVSGTHVKWTATKGIPAKPSPILHDGLIYLIDDTGVASCIEASSGKLVWKERIGGNYSASPIFVGGHIYFGSQDGKVTVIKPGRKYQQVAENQVDDRIMASPAIVGNSILLRTEHAIYRIQ
jgi:outer membrane protein assembly factor BamB